MRRIGHVCKWRPVSGIAAVGVLALSVSAFAGSRPVVQRIQLTGNEEVTDLTVSAGGGVAQGAVPAAIYRSTQCGFISWIGGQPSWLDQVVLYNDAGAGAALRSYTTRVCYDTCHRLGADFCIAGGGPCESGL